MSVELKPHERAALTVAWAQVSRGEFPMPACATVCVAALARLFYGKDGTPESAICDLLVCVDNGCPHDDECPSGCRAVEACRESIRRNRPALETGALPLSCECPAAPGQDCPLSVGECNERMERRKGAPIETGASHGD